MTTDRLLTSCGAINVLKNGTPIPFDAADSQYNTMWIDSGEVKQEIAVHPDSCIEITIDTQRLAVGDKIVCALDKNIVSIDGGGERLLNTTGKYNGFDIALGAPDSDDYEYGWDPNNPNLPSDVGQNGAFVIPVSTALGDLNLKSLTIQNCTMIGLIEKISLLQ